MNQIELVGGSYKKILFVGQAPTEALKVAAFGA